jgi:hypothetical protein
MWIPGEVSYWGELFGNFLLALTAGSWVSSKWFNPKVRVGLRAFVSIWLAVAILCSIVLTSRPVYTSALDWFIKVGIALAWTFVLGYLLCDPVLNPWVERFDGLIVRSVDRVLTLLRLLLNRVRKRTPEAEVLGPVDILTALPTELSFDDAWRMVQTEALDNIWIKTRRSKKRKGLWRKTIFVLDARMAVSPDIRKEIAEYDLGGLIVYDSLARKHHTEQMKARHEATKQKTGWREPIEKQVLGLVKFMFRTVLVVISATRVGLAVRVTVASLMKGAHIECRSLNELLTAEEAIAKAGGSIRAFIDEARTFDGREEISVF